MGRNGIAAKGIDHKYIEILRAFFRKLPLQGESRISQDRFNLCR